MNCEVGFAAAGFESSNQLYQQALKKSFCNLFELGRKVAKFPEKSSWQCLFFMGISAY